MISGCGEKEDAEEAQAVQDAAAALTNGDTEEPIKAVVAMQVGPDFLELIHVAQFGLRGRHAARKISGWRFIV